MKMSQLDTPLGPMLAIGNEEALYLLEFIDRRGLEHEIGRWQKKTKSTITPGLTEPIRSIKHELERYFKGQLKEFKTPLFSLGSPFQQLTWNALKKIPYGETRSYANVSAAIGKPTSFRAVANANAANPISIVVPCHRVIGADGSLSGYGGGVTRKEWLLRHESTY